jgi:hypothetical protein
MNLCRYSTCYLFPRVFAYGRMVIYMSESRDLRQGTQEHLDVPGHPLRACLIQGL